MLCMYVCYAQVPLSCMRARGPGAAAPQLPACGGSLSDGTRCTSGQSQGPLLDALRLLRRVNEPPNSALRWVHGPSFTKIVSGPGSRPPASLVLHTHHRRAQTATRCTPGPCPSSLDLEEAWPPCPPRLVSMSTSMLNISRVWILCVCLERIVSCIHMDLTGAAQRRAGVLAHRAP